MSEGVEKVYNGVPVCSRAHRVCSCPYAHAWLVTLIERLPGRGSYLPDLLVSWAFGTPCWLRPDDVVVPGHLRSRFQLIWDDDGDQGDGIGEVV